MHTPGTRLGDRYRLDERIGAGGMGEVWRATDEVLGRTVAVKVMLPSLLADPKFSQRFLTEARAMATVTHPAVVAVHDYRSDGEIAFLVMEYVQGEPLSATLRRLGRLDPTWTMALLAQAAGALQAVHEQGIVHRDIKPANLLIRTDGSLVITDFGIARAETDTHLTSTGAVLGTPTYLSPEQVLGQPATPRSDLYSLGLVGYECLGGRRPFEGESPIAAALQRLHQAPKTLSMELPPAVLAVVMRSLEVEPERRWATAAEFAQMAWHASQGGLVAPSPGLPPPAAPPAGAGSPPAAAPPPRDAPPPGAVPVTPPPPGPVPPPGTPGSEHSRHQPAPHPAARPEGKPGSSRRRRPVVLLLAVFVVVVVVSGGGLMTLQILRPDSSESGADGSGPPPQIDQVDAESAAQLDIAGAGLAPCGDLLCPVEPICWGGLNSTGNHADPITLKSCVEPHFWETFVATVLPEEAIGIPLDSLADHDVARVCSQQTLAQRSTDPATTEGWKREPWPMEIEGGWLLYCMTGDPEGESVGSVVRTA